MMTAGTYGAGALTVLREQLCRRFPDYPEIPSLSADLDLLRGNRISEPELLEIYAAAFHTEVVTDEEPLLAALPENMSLDFLTLCNCGVLDWNDKRIQFMVSDPYNIGNVAYQLGRSDDERKIELFFGRKTLIERLLGRLQNDEDREEQQRLDDENTLRSLAGEAKIVRLVNDIFSQALELGASDIHIEPGEEVVSVRCRVDGVLTEIMTTPMNQFPAIASRIKLIGGLNIAESRLPQDGRTNFSLGKIQLDMRISTIPVLNGESIVLRLLTKENVTFDLRKLGMSDAHLRQFERLIQIPHGIILVVGPTGSGKTTTLYSVINQLNDKKKKIITIEDPVEYKTPGLCQVQVNPKIGVTFAAGLRSIVRQDPDIILVGEIRDRETADIAINAALTGHLVLSTLHTNDAVGAVTRLLDMGMENFLVSSALFGVLSQRLVRRICPVCHGQKQGTKCKKCNGTGYKGRSGIFELLILDDKMRAAVNRNASSDELQRIAVEHGMITLAQDGAVKVADGITTQEELDRSTAEV